MKTPLLTFCFLFFPLAVLAAKLDMTMQLQGIGFHVTSPNDSSINKVTIQPSGLTGENTAIVREVDGQITGAEIADLNADGSPEIFIYITSAGSGSYGSLLAFAVNNKKSLTEIYLPPIDENPAAAKGYMGHDEFAVVEQHLVRRFPVYLEGDSNAKPTGGIRQLEYKLMAGEAGWILKLDKIQDIR